MVALPWVLHFMEVKDVQYAVGEVLLRCRNVPCTEYIKPPPQVVEGINVYVGM